MQVLTEPCPECRAAKGELHLIGCSKTPGTKLDGGKARWDLLPVESVSPIVDVLTYGAKKYAPENWRRVPDARARYYAAALRHLTSWWAGEEIDSESGLRHLAHAGCCVLFLLALPRKTCPCDAPVGGPPCTADKPCSYAKGRPPEDWK